MFGSRDRASVALVLATLIVAGCSGDDDTAATTTVAVAPTTAPSTSAVPSTTETPPTTSDPAPTTSAPASTAPPSSTEPTTAPSSTTLPEGVPPRVTFPDDPDLQAVVDAYYRYVDALRAASADPSNPAFVQALEATVGEPLASRVDAFVADLVASGEAILPNDDLPTRSEIDPLTVEIVGNLGGLEACVIDGDVRVVVGGSSDGSDLVVNDQVVSSSLSYSLNSVDGRWVVSDIQRFGRWENQVGCGGQ